jgi:hypothetical protein
MILSLLCLPLRAARCGARLGFVMGVGAALVTAGAACRLASSARRARAHCQKRQTLW